MFECQVFITLKNPDENHEMEVNAPDLQLVKVHLGVLRIRLPRVPVLAAVLPLPLAPQALDDVLVHVANVNVPRLKLTREKDTISKFIDQSMSNSKGGFQNISESYIWQT